MIDGPSVTFLAGYGAFLTAGIVWRLVRSNVRLPSPTPTPAPEPLPVPVPAPAPKKKKRRKKKHKAAPLPTQRPPRPKVGLRVRRLDGGLSFVPRRIHLDECASSYPLKGLLEAHGFDVTMTHEVGLLKASDRKQLNHAIRNRAVIVTFDGDFLDFHDAGERHCGIIHAPSIPIPGAWHLEILRVLLQMSMRAVEV